MKRILLIGLDYYGYTKQIIEAIERIGYDIDFFPIEENTIFNKISRNYLYPLYRKAIDAYHRKIITSAQSQQYDIVFFIQVHNVSHDNLNLAKQCFPAASFLLYNWDSLVTHDYQQYIPYFDRVATFDSRDAKQLGLMYEPLFAVPAFFDIDQKRAKKYDIFFVGSIVTMYRFDALERLYRFCQISGLTTKFHLKANLVTRFKLWRQKRHLPGITPDSLNFDQIVEFVEQTNAVFDFANHRQSGFTMRFIETMCAGRKIITDNPHVLTQDFYRSDRFLIVKDYDFSAVPAFLAEEITSDLPVREFSVDSWATRLLTGL